METVVIPTSWPSTTDTTSNTTGSTTTTPTEAQDWEVLRTSFIVYLPSFVGMLLLFCYLRLKFPVVYNVRNTVQSLHNPHAATSHGYWSWIWYTMQIHETEILQTCGMDAVCLLRITRMGSYLSLIAVFCSIFLVPVYELKSDTTTGTGSTNGFASTTSTSLPNGSNSFAATVVAAYIIFGSTMLLILREFQWFIARRETFLSTPQARNYTIYVSGIPPQYRSNAGLAQFFRRVIAHDVVHSAVVAMHVPKLSAAMDRHDRLVKTIERMKTIRDLNVEGREPMHFVLGPNRGEILERVPAIPYYTEQLDRVQSEIDELQQLISTRQDTIHLPVEQYGSSTATGTPNFPEGSTHGQSSVHCPSSDGIFVSATSLASGAFVDPTAMSLYRDDSSSIPTGKVSTHDSEIADIDCDGIVVAASGTNESRQTDMLHSDNAVSVMNESLDLPPETNAVIAKHQQNNGKEVVTILDAGFVTFRKLSAVAVALQAVQSTIPFQMVVSEAPSPDQILWNNIGLTQKVLQLRRFVAVALTTLLCIFWTVPVTFLVSLTEIQVLQEKLPFLEDWLTAAPWLEPLLNQISPLLLSFLNSVVVPMLLRLLSTVEGVIGISHQEASLFSKLATFHVCL